MAFSFDDVMKEAGIVDIDYINKATLAENDVVFCISAIDDVEVINSKFAVDRQWRFTIVTRLTSGDVRNYYVSFPYNAAKRDAMVVAIQNKLKELASENQAPIVHSLHIVAKHQAKYDMPYYKLESISSGGTLACTCVTDGTVDVNVTN